MLILSLLVFFHLQADVQGYYSIIDDSVTIYGQGSLYLEICCNDTNLGKAFNIIHSSKKQKKEYLFCHKLKPKNCKGQSFNHHTVLLILL